MKRKVLLMLVLGMMIAALSAFFAACDSPIELSAPENVRYDGNTITWNSVDHADRYTVQINGGEEKPVTVCQFPYYATEGAEVTVTVKAVSGMDKVVSSGETTITFHPLGDVKDFTVADDGTMTWQPVENGNAKYIIRVDGQEYATVPATTFSDLPEGAHSVSVRSTIVGDNSWYSRWSTAKNLTILGVVAKENITYDNATIRWSPVSGAVGYEVSINGIPTGNVVTGTSYEYSANRTDFEINVRAIGNHTVSFNGKNSEAKKFIYLATVPELRVKSGILEWDLVEKATGYKVKVNNSEFEVATTTYEGLTENMSLTVSVKPFSSDNSYFSDWSAEKNIFLLTSPKLSWNASLDMTDGVAKNTFTWNSVNRAASYTVRVVRPDGGKEEYPGSTTGVDFSYAYLNTGKYLVSVKSVADSTDGTTYDSKYSPEFEVTRLPAPSQPGSDFIISDSKLLSNGFTVNFGPVDNATRYKLVRDDVGAEAQYSQTNQFKVYVPDTSSTTEQRYNYTIGCEGDSSRIAQRRVTLGSLAADALSFEITVLAAPRDPQMSGFSYTYNEVSGNRGYCVDVSGTPYVSESLSCDLSGIVPGAYTVRVCAMGDGARVLPSVYSTPLSLSRLAAPYDIRIMTTEGEGRLQYEAPQQAQSVTVTIDDDREPTNVTEVGNINARITTLGTTLYMVAVADYYDQSTQTYYMTSPNSETRRFTKLETPGFGDVRFSNNKLLWNAPGNLNTSTYTPTYEVYNGDIVLNGQVNGTSYDISELEGGQSYTFYVRAIGDGREFVDSDKPTDPATIYKLATPQVQKEGGKYTWSSVDRSTGYRVMINGALAPNGDIQHISGRDKYEYEPHFDELTETDGYRIEVWAVGDNGYTTIDSKHHTFQQITRQLEMPTFTFKYDKDYCTTDGQVVVTIGSAVSLAAGYRYSVGGVGSEIKNEMTYSKRLDQAGTYDIQAQAVGGVFDEQGIYYIDSKWAGTRNSDTLTILAAPNESSIKVTGDGEVVWSSVGGAKGYEIEIQKDGVWSQVVSVQSPSYKLSADYKGSTIWVRIRAIGDKNHIVSSVQVTTNRSFSIPN